MQLDLIHSQLLNKEMHPPNTQDEQRFRFHLFGSELISFSAKVLPSLL